MEINSLLVKISINGLINMDLYFKKKSMKLTIRENMFSNVNLIKNVR